MNRAIANLLPLLLAGALSARLFAATLYVDGANGSNTAAGTSPATAWRTIQRAADAVNPGDEVRIQPGVYFESVQLTRAGTAAQPITFRAAGPGVIVSGAHPAIRAGQAVWTVEAGAPQLYSTPLAYEPATVLAGEVDLFAYLTLDELKTFTIANVRGSGLPAPGPRAGFAYSGGKLYVRLNARYGSQNPAAHTMKVSPPRAGGFRGDVIQSPTDYNWSVQTTAPAHVLLEGFTFESPGFAGVWVQHGKVTVRRGLFLGCRTGVRGWGESENAPLPTQISADVIVEGCEFSQFPAWQDMLDVVAAAEALPTAQRDALPTFFWWSRKGGERSSEIGLVTAAGLRWKILGNFIHDTIDGLSFMALGWSDECEVAYNHFDRLIDNAVESENHARHLRVHRNFVRDVFEPFSYQPNAGGPYPASIWFYRNVVTATAEGTAFWKKPILKWTPGCFKISPAAASFPGIGLDGLLCFNNTIHFPYGNVLTINNTGATAGPVKFYNNLIAAIGLQSDVPGATYSGTEFSHNLVAPAEAGQTGPGTQFAGSGGQALASPAAFGVENFAAGRFALTLGSPAIGGGVLLPGVADSSVDVGALPTAPQFTRFDQWRFQYFYDRLYDPAVSGAAADPEVDRLENVLECLLARHPWLADSAGATALAVDTAARLVLTFTRRTPLPEDLAWSVEASGDLATWSAGPGVTETLPSTPAGAGFQTERVRDLTASAAGRFLRLRAAQLDVPPGPVPLNDPPAPSGVGDVLLDGFDDGARTDQLNSLDAAWFFIQAPDGGTPAALSIVNDAAGIGSGNALAVNNVSQPQTSSKSLGASFVNEVLATTGDRLVLSFDFRFTNIGAHHAANFFRFGLYDDRGRPYSGDNQFFAPPAHRGYLASVNFGNVAAVPALIRESGLNGNINSDEDLTTVGSFGGAAFSVPAGPAKTSAVLTLTKTAGGLSFRLQIFNAAGATLYDGTTADANPQTTFNAVIFSTSQSEADYLLDNLQVTFTPAP